MKKEGKNPSELNILPKLSNRLKGDHLRELMYFEPVPLNKLTVIFGDW